MDTHNFPESAGFVREPVGTHSSRTIMLQEVSQLFASSSPDTPYAELRQLVVDGNILQKNSMAGRAKTFRHLREFYSLDPQIPIYQGLRFLWSQSDTEHPVLAMLCALARDPVLRASADAVLRTPVGSTVQKEFIQEHIRDSFPGRYSEDVLGRVVRNLSSSWTQSGHLSGRSEKIRQQAIAGPASTAYALLLGHLQGLRGRRLLETLWARILDLPPARVEDCAFEASRKGWISFRHSGDVVDIDVSPIPGAV